MDRQDFVAREEETHEMTYVRSGSKAPDVFSSILI